MPAHSKKVLIKYIHMKETTNPKVDFHRIEDFEYKKTIFEHYSYDHMVEQVKELCPEGFQCVHPLALHHEISWDMRHEQHRLYRPIDQLDYALLNWCKTPPTPVCVEIETPAEMRCDAAPKTLLARAPPLDRLHSRPCPATALQLR
jgi:hypothetical protein